MALDNPKQKLETRQEQASIRPDPKNQVVEDLDKKSEQNFYTRNITRIEGGNLRGGAPGRGTDGKRTIESTEKAVKTIHEKFHPKTVISFENTADDSANAEILAAEKKAWVELGVKFIELPVAETELSKLFEDNLRQTTLEAFNALDNGSTFVHCTHGLQRARAFTEIWRATRGIDRRKAIQENPNLNNKNKSEDHRKCGETAQEIIEKILKNPLEARAELSKEVAPTPENLADELLAPKIALIGDSIGEGISETIAREISDKHQVTAISRARLRKTFIRKKTGQKITSIYEQLDSEKIDPKKTPYLVIQGGTNDLGMLKTEEIANELKNIYDKALAMGFEKVIIVTIPPHTSSPDKEKTLEVNDLLRKMAANGEIKLYDLYGDYVKKDPTLSGIKQNNVHPNQKGYKILGNLLVGSFRAETTTPKNYSEKIGTTLAGQETAGTPETPPQPETTQTPQSTEHLSEKSKELQGKLAKEIEAITEEQRKLDEQKLSQAEIKDIRFNTALLNGDEDKVKEEMTRRLAQYTEKQGDGGLRLNYVKFNSSEHDHETNIGLGDIMPPEYKRIVVVTSGGEVRMGKRGIVSTSRESNRIGYIDESTGSYLATFTGDTVYVLDPPLTDEKELAELLAKEKEARKSGSQTYSEYKESSSGGGYAQPGHEGYGSPEADPKLASEYEEYLQKRNSIKEKLNPSAISEIPETPQTKEIPKKKEGVIRMAVFGDTDDKSHKTTKQLYLDKFQEKLPEWEVDFALGVGDYISATASSKEKYREVANQVRQEFKRFNTPYALAIGNHDKNSNGTDTMQDLYKDGLKDYEGINGAYSYTLGNATFVIFNEGNKTITEEQTSFFEKKSSEAKGAVYLVNHIPPYQFAYGAGLPEDGNQTVKNFKKIQEIAKEKLESQGKPFYVISGDNHFAAVIGNFMSPGGMAMNYYGLNEKRLKSVCSGAVVDMDKETGKILAVYFRSADSNFEDPMPELQNAMAYGTELPSSSQSAETSTSGSLDTKKLTSHIDDAERRGEKFWDYGSETAEGLWEYSPDEGRNIWNFGKAYCKYIGIGEDKINVIWGTFTAESGFDPFCKEGSCIGLSQPKESSWQDSVSVFKAQLSKGNPYAERILANQYKKGVEYYNGKKINLETVNLPAKKDQLNYSRCNPYLQVMHTAHWIERAIKKYQGSGINLQELNSFDQVRYIYLATHEGHAGALKYVRFMKTLENLGANIEVTPTIAANEQNWNSAAALLRQKMSENDPQIMAAISQLSSGQKNRLRDDHHYFLKTWYKTSRIVASTATRGGTSRETASSSTEQQQPPQSTELAATGLTPREKAVATSIRSMPKPKFDYDAVYVLGCGDPEKNRLRAVIGAELALKYNAAFLTSGGKVSDYHKSRNLSEGREAYRYVTNNPYYRDQFVKNEIRTGIEDQSGSTVGNIKNALNYFHKKGFKKILIVTDSTSHAKRAIHTNDGTGLKDLYPEAEVSFYSPERPDIDRNLA